MMCDVSASALRRTQAPEYARHRRGPDSPYREDSQRVKVGSSRLLQVAQW
jgi:hypothetical protein